MCTPYVTSLFPSKCDADILLKITAFVKLGIDLGNIVQLSMDGPNVSLKLFKWFRDFVNEADFHFSKLLEVGTCPLHIVHRAFKTGHQKSDCNVNEYLRNNYYLLK